MATLVALETTRGFPGRLRAAWDDGHAVLPLPAGLPPAERQRLDAALRPGELVADGVALVIATSGSTGAPKGVELTHAALTAATRASLERLAVTDGDRWLCCLPLHHVAGLAVLLRAWALGTEPVVHHGFEIAAVAEADATHVSLVPTMLARLLDADVDVSRFASILLGGAPLPAVLRDRAIAAGAQLVETYGMTETCGGCVYDGWPLDGVEVDIDAPDGVIRLRGPMLFRGYRGSAPHDGWFDTFDLGRLDPDGRLVVIGRRDDVINTGGEKVVAGEVAALLLRHRAVAEVEVVGRVDAEWGQRVVAAVVPRDRAAPPTIDELRTFVAAQAAPHKAPRELIVLDALPRLPSGKVDRQALQRD